MGDARSRRAQWIGGACLLAVAGLVAVRGTSAGESTAPAPDAPQCGASAEASVDAQVDVLMSRAMQDLREQREAAGLPAESDWVVLNNRGFNYGPPPGPRFDALLRDTSVNPSKDAR
jgi:hypothetical protein